MAAQEERVTDMMDVDDVRETAATAQTTSWEQFEETGHAKGEFTLKLRNFSKLIEGSGTDNSQLSEEFEIAGYSWRLLVFPKGNVNSSTLSVFLQSAEAKFLPMRIMPNAKFKLIVHNHLNEAESVWKETEHRFSSSEDDWGFSKFMEYKDLIQKRDAFLPDDTLHITVQMEVQLEEKYTGSTRAQTGFVGLKNQGATCYMNSLLQTLFHVPQFRRAVYHMPTEEGEDPDASISLALKYLFFRLQFSPTPVSTKELIKSFGWVNMEAFQQHDVEELELKLCEKLEEKMKGTIVDKMVDHLLKGKMYSYIECINVDYKSTRSEEFLDIQLDVMGCKGLYDSFDKIVEVETMDGDNKYDAEGHGLQDARKGVLIEELPPVLQLHLKRFDYDRTYWVPIKVNSRYEFYEELDLSREDNKYLAPTADTSIAHTYKLYSVLVHSGASHGGHYYAYIRPDGEKWFKFDDELVTAVKDEEAIEQQFGDDSAAPALPMGRGGGKMRSLNNAYMLVYIRRTDWDRVMQTTGAEELEEHVRSQLKSQLAAKDRKRRAKMQAHRFVTLKVVTQDVIRQHVEKEAFDLANLDELDDRQILKVDKTKTWTSVMEEVAQLTGIEPARQLYWLFEARANSSVRPNVAMTPQAHADRPVKEFHRKLLYPQSATGGRGLARAKSTATTLKPLELYVTELPAQPQGSPLAAGVTVYLKQYDPRTSKLTFWRSLWVLKGFTFQAVACHMLFGDMKKDALDIQVWEEVRTDPELMMEVCPLHETFGAHRVGDGDVFIVQHVLPPAEAAAAPFPDAAQYMSHLHSLRRLCFLPLPGTTAARPVASGDPIERPTSPAPVPSVHLEVSKTATYADVVARLGERIQVDPRNLRLTLPHHVTHAPRAKAIGAGQDFVLSCCQIPTQTYDVYYEALDMALEDLEKLKTLKVKLVKGNLELVKHLTVRLSPDATIVDLLAQAAQHVKPGFADGRPLRAVKVFRSRVFEVCPPDAAVADLETSYWEIRVEPTAEDDLAVMAQCAAAGAQWEYVCLAHSVANAQNGLEEYGDPLVCAMAPSEPFGSLQQRVQTRLKVDATEFNTWTWGLRPDPEADPIALSDPHLPVVQELHSSTEHLTMKTRHPPFISMVHEQKGYGARRPPARNYGQEAQITLL